MNDTVDPKKPKKGAKPGNLSVVPPIGLPAIIPHETQESLKAISELLQRYIVPNSRIFEEASKALSVYGSVFKDLDLSASIEASKILANQIRSLEDSKIYQSPIVQFVGAANLSVGHLFEATDINRMSELLRQATFPSEEWKVQAEAIKRVIGEFPRYDLALQSHLAEISKFSVLSQAVVSQLRWDDIGDALNVGDTIRGTLQKSFTGFTQAYSKVFESWEQQPSLLLLLPRVISKFPAVEFFNGVDVVDAVTSGTLNETGLQQDKLRLEKEVRQETEHRLEELLRQLNPEFIIPLHGARQSLDSENPDRIRHFAISLRELFTHVLHTIAPDEKIREWSNAPENYDHNKPTRRARLKYICRTLNQEPFSTFIEKDIDAGLEFLNLFQRGTHEVAPKYTNLQLTIMLARMEALLRFILEIWSMD